MDESRMLQIEAMLIDLDLTLSEAVRLGKVTEAEAEDFCRWDLETGGT